MADGGRAALLAVASVVGAFALYAGALGYPFIGDDQLAVSGNPTVSRPSATGFRALWVTDYWRGIAPDGRLTEMSTDRNLYRPVTIASLWLTSWLAGIDVRPFRVGNVVLHALAATLIGVLCIALGWRRGAVVAVAFVLLHPVATDVVNRIVGRADVLAVIGVTSYVLVQWRAGDRGPTVARMLAAFVASCIALGSKESGAVLVPLAVFVAWIYRPASRAPGGVDRGQWRVMVPLGAAAALYLLGRQLAVEFPTYAPTTTWDLGGNPVWGAGLGVRLPVALALAAHYGRLVLWPTSLIAFDVPPVVPNWGDMETWLGAVLLVTLASALAVAAWRRHAVSIGVAWWLLSFVIVSQLFVPIGAYREVRFAYALVVATALVGAWLFERAAARGGATRIVSGVVVVVAIVVAVPAVWHRNADYRDLQALLEADVRQRRASPAALIRLANIHDQARRDDLAEAAFARVIELAPASAQARYEFAGYHERRGRPDRARALHQQAVTLNPEHYLSLMALGNMALGDRDIAAAEMWLTRAAAVAPDDPWVIYNLAVLDDNRGQRARAVESLTALVDRRPDFALATRALDQIRKDEARKAGR